jgi:hypothetical protein
MFSARYFAKRFFPGRYWPPSAAQGPFVEAARFLYVPGAQAIAIAGPVTLRSISSPAPNYAS